MKMTMVAWLSLFAICVGCFRVSGNARVDIRKCEAFKDLPASFAMTSFCARQDRRSRAKEVTLEFESGGPDIFVPHELPDERIDPCYKYLDPVPVVRRLKCCVGSGGETTSCTIKGRRRLANAVAGNARVDAGKCAEFRDLPASFNMTTFCARSDGRPSAEAVTLELEGGGDIAVPQPLPGEGSYKFQGPLAVHRKLRCCVGSSGQTTTCTVIGRKEQ